MTGEQLSPGASTRIAPGRRLVDLDRIAAAAGFAMADCREHEHANLAVDTAKSSDVLASLEGYYRRLMSLAA